MTTVQGRCPACRWESLMLGDGGHVTCSRLDCADDQGADAYDRRLMAPLSEQATAALRQRLESGNLARRSVRRAASHDGPSIAEATAVDRNWDVEKDGE